MNSGIGHYEYQFTVAELADDFGGLLSTANEVSVPTSVTGAISHHFENDMFRFRAVAGESYAISMFNLGDDDSGTLELYDENGVFVARSNAELRDILWRAPRSADMYVRVGQFSETLFNYELVIDHFGTTATESTSSVLAVRSSETALAVSDWFSAAIDQGTAYHVVSEPNVAITIRYSNGEVADQINTMGHGRAAWLAPKSDTYYFVADLDGRSPTPLVVDLAIAYGDVNLDGFFDSSDLVRLFQLGEYEDGIANNSDSWLEGDWNQDGDFDSSDLVAAFSRGRYFQSTPAAMVYVADDDHTDVEYSRQRRSDLSAALVDVLFDEETDNERRLRFLE